MNSTTTLSTSPTSYGVGTLVGIWTGLCFSVISCGVVGWKACIDYSPLRVSSFVVGLVSCIGLSVVNYLRLDSYIPETVFHVYKVVSMLLFNNLIMVVTFWVAARLYEPGPMPKNRLYKFSISMVVLMNIMAGASLIFGQGLQLTNVGTDMYTGAAVVALTAGTAIFVYAFYPVFRLKGMNEKPSSAMPIGVWYLTGVAILFILGLIPNGIAMAYPLETHRAIELNLTTATIFLRYCNSQYPLLAIALPRH
ncbi:hypothetical protein BC938DRAFT_477909 [Jimgerdemannia flammicorona]|uniref:Uncharacterized protein n=1 Tax=Jimgerdemannia flammicorona TaxID=994334 RepID=A0A433QNM9_9FUNG|nr:hypothetical protein BC938DRAFT_477909 [Jimgerdemannia flammicorona]